MYVYMCIYCSMSSLQTVQATVAVTYKEVPKVNGETFSVEELCIVSVSIVPWLHPLLRKGSSLIGVVAL